MGNEMGAGRRTRFPHKSRSGLAEAGIQVVARKLQLPGWKFESREPVMTRSCFVALSAVLLASLAGCATPPATDIKGPLTARPAPRPTTIVNDGAIYQPQEGVSLFTDRRAHEVGDIITVNLVEKTQISRSFDNKQNRTGNASMSFPSPTVLGYTNVLGNTSVAPTSDSNTEAKTQLTNNSAMKGSMTVTVTGVLPNGNLQVAGEKEVAFDNDTQYIRLAGVVNPKDIAPDGTVNSNQMADVKLESKASTSLDRSTVMSLLSRFFLAVLPF